jgi:hypothetical protein
MLGSEHKLGSEVNSMIHIDDGIVLTDISRQFLEYIEMMYHLNMSLSWKKSNHEQITATSASPSQACQTVPKPKDPRKVSGGQDMREPYHSMVQNCYVAYESDSQTLIKSWTKDNTLDLKKFLVSRNPSLTSLVREADLGIRSARVSLAVGVILKATTASVRSGSNQIGEVLLAVCPANVTKEIADIVRQYCRRKKYTLVIYSRSSTGQFIWQIRS